LRVAAAMDTAAGPPAWCELRGMVYCYFFRSQGWV